MKNKTISAADSLTRPAAKPEVHQRIGMAGWLLGGMVLLAGCTTPAQRNAATISETDRQTLQALTKNLAEESAKLSAAREEWQQQIEKRETVILPEPVPPQHDPLEDIVVTIQLQNATLPAILHVLSEQSKANILIDPEVMAIEKRASLYLNRVTARELYRHILETFDLAGTTDGRTIKIGVQEERFFNIDFLNSRLNVDIAAGGNVFGSTAPGGSGGGADLIRSNISVDGGTGKQAEPYDQLESSLKSILGSGQQGQAEKADTNVAAGEMSAGRSNYTLNRASGTLYVKARPSQIRSVEKLIDRNKTALRRQVLIEAQLLDVELNDSFQFGVDWTLLRNHVAATVGSVPATASAMSAIIPGNSGLPARTLSFPAQQIGTPAAGSGGIAYSDKNVFAALNLLRAFGNVKVLSNPSIRVRNNSPALLSVGTSSRFVSKSSVTITNPGGGAATTSADVQTDSIFSGVVVGVVPFISERGNVDLLIHPMQTEVDAASLQLLDVGGGNRVTLPRVSYKGMTTTLNVKDGDTVILGGLIDQNSASNNSGVPGLSDVPGFGRAFGAENSTNRSRELIMVLKVKLL